MENLSEDTGSTAADLPRRRRDGVRGRMTEFVDLLADASGLIGLVFIFILMGLAIAAPLW